MGEQDSSGRKSEPLASEPAPEVSDAFKSRQKIDVGAGADQHSGWKNAKSKVRILCAAAAGLVAALAVQAAEAQQRGTADIVWQHFTGQVHYWPMRAGQRQGGINVFTPIGNDWTLRGVGDVDGDGTADIVWQHCLGQVHYWPMRATGSGRAGSTSSTPVGNDWTLRGVGDVDGDGTADIVWQHIGGQVHYWPMRNGQRQGGINVFTPVGNDWALRGVGDVDGDGTADIVWQHISGQVHYWPMRAGQRQGGINSSRRSATTGRCAASATSMATAPPTSSGSTSAGRCTTGRCGPGSGRAGSTSFTGPVGNDWVLRGVGDVDGAVSVQHSLQVRRFNTSSLTNADADKILGDATTVLQTNDGAGDVACATAFGRTGDVTAFTEGDGSIDSAAEFNALVALPGHIKIVNQINWCGALIPNVIGCAPVPGNSLAVVRFTPSLEGILLAHEYGHNKGLNHRNDDPNAVMNGTIGATHLRVNASECTAYQVLPATTVGMAQAGPPQPGASGASPLMDVRDFVRQVFIHGIPYEEARRYDASAVPVLLAMLQDPIEEELLGECRSRPGNDR